MIPTRKKSHGRLRSIRPGYWIVVLERIEDNRPRDFFVGGISYPPKGQLPLLKRHDGKPDDCAIEVGGHGFILLCDEFEGAFKFPTEHDAKRIAALMGGKVEFIP